MSDVSKARARRQHARRIDVVRAAQVVTVGQKAKRAKKTAKRADKREAEAANDA